MLRLMRDKAGSWFIKIILGAIVIVFVFWGVGSFRSQRFNKVAEVNGAPISVEEHQKTYNSLIERYRRQFGSSLDDKTIKMLGLRKQALDQLVDQTVLIQEAEKLDFKISDDTLAESIQSVPAFQMNGSFDANLYTRVLGANRLSPEEFELMQRQNLLLDKLRNFIIETVKVSDDEVLAQYRYDNASMDMDYVFIDTKTYEDAEVTDEEVKTFFDAHKENYKTNPMVKAQFVRFDPKKYTDAAAVTDEEIKEYFEIHPEEFSEPKTVKARHILFKADKTSSDEVVAQKKEKALEVMKMAQDGQDFAELAKAHSEGPTKESGGDLGTFKYETMVKPFADKAFSMNAGDVSDPVRTQFGWHLIKVEAVNEPSQKTLEESADGIRKKLADEKAKVAAYDAAEDFYDIIYEGDDLKKSAQDPSIEVVETDFFTRSGPKNVAPKAQFSKAAFTLSENQLSQIQDFSDGYYLIQLMEKKPAKVDEFKNVKEKVKADLVKEKKQEKAKADADALQAKLTEGTAWEEAIAAYQLTSKTTGFFKRNDSIPGIGPARDIAKAAFELTPENKYAKAPMERGGKYYIIAFKNQKAADAEKFESEMQGIRKRLLQQKQAQAFTKWLAQIKENSTIVIDENFIE